MSQKSRRIAAVRYDDKQITLPRPIYIPVGIDPDYITPKDLAMIFKTIIEAWVDDFYKLQDIKELIKRYSNLNDNYEEQCSGSTKAYVITVPDCISVEEDEDYTDDCFPNKYFEIIEEINR